MTNAVRIPQTAPFDEQARQQLDQVLGTASLVQRAWLSGFLAGIDAATAPAGTAAATAVQPAEPLAILFLSESGNAERLAHEAAALARKSGFKPKVIDFADLDASSLVGERRLLVIAATWGEGEPPARATRAYHELMQATAPRLDDTAFSVLALGDSAYAQFCATGKAIDERLAELGARRVAPRIDCDLDFEAPAAAWLRTSLDALAPPRSQPTNVVAVDFAARAGAESGAREIVTAEVLEHVNLNSSRSDKQTIHLVLGFDGAMPAYEPGDSLDLFPENDPALAEAVLAAVGLSGDDRLRAALVGERDITTLSAPVVERYAASFGTPELRQLVSAGETAKWVEGRQLIDLLGAFPSRLSADELVALTRPLPPRAYSVASSRREVGDEAHLLVAPVRYHSHGRDRAGVASTYVADRIKPGARLRVRLKPNRHFRLPSPETDIIMIGPGTGIAPFRAFVQERRAVAATGRNWLFFGDRRFTHDFLYQLEWQQALKDGSLARLDLAFSRDTPAKVYVQHRLWEARRDLVDWLDRGAHLFVCGDAKAMAKDVRTALVNAIADVRAVGAEVAEQEVATLERDRRYLQDVY